MWKITRKTRKFATPDLAFLFRAPCAKLENKLEQQKKYEKA